MVSYTTVLFDAGGTLWYSCKTVPEIWQEVLSSQGYQLPVEQINKAWEKVRPLLQIQMDTFETSGVPTKLEEIQRSLDGFNRKILKDLGITDKDDILIARLTNGFKSNAELYPETMRVLEELRTRGYRMSIVSNGVNQESTAQYLGIARYFEAIIGSVHVGFKKPMPEIYHLALSRLGIGPEQAIMVGDTWEADVVGPEGVGIKGIHLNRGEEPSPRAEAIKDLWGVIELLK